MRCTPLGRQIRNGNILYNFIPKPNFQSNFLQSKNSLRNATIQAMSNLLSANIDSGLMHSIGLGYHKDLQTRAAFMEVLTKILQQGTEFDTLAENVLADRYDQVMKSNWIYYLKVCL